MRTHAPGRPDVAPVRTLNASRSEPCCGKCGYRTRLVPNPYYGSGLAVHRYLRVCRRCPWTVIVRESKSQPQPQPVPVVEAPAARPVRRLMLPWSNREAS